MLINEFDFILSTAMRWDVRQAILTVELLQSEIKKPLRRWLCAPLSYCHSPKPVSQRMFKSFTSLQVTALLYGLNQIRNQLHQYFFLTVFQAYRICITKNAPFINQYIQIQASCVSEQQQAEIVVHALYFLRLLIYYTMVF